jgi:carboxyl-terminal processing protease
MKALIARDLWDMNEYYHTINAANESVKKALELLKKPGDLFGR